MKKILIAGLCAIFFAASSNSSEIKSQSFKNNLEEDYVVIYQRSDELKYKNLSLSFFNNVELRGKPEFYIHNNEIVSKEGQHFIFSNSFEKCNPQCKELKYIPIDFIRIYSNVVSIAIKNYKNGIPFVMQGDKPYFFTLPNFVLDINWRTFTKKDLIEDFLKHDGSFKKFKDEIQECVISKKISCLKKHFGKNLTEDIFLARAKKRLVYEDKILCDKFIQFRNQNKGIGVDEVPEDILKEVTSIDFIFKIVQRNFSDFVSLSVEDFGKKIILTTRKDLQEGCLYQSLDFWAQYVKVDNVWKLDDIDFSAFQD